MRLSDEVDERPAPCILNMITATTKLYLHDWYLRLQRQQDAAAGSPDSDMGLWWGGPLEVPTPGGEPLQTIADHGAAQQVTECSFTLFVGFISTQMLPGYEHVFRVTTLQHAIRGMQPYTMPVAGRRRGSSPDAAARRAGLGGQR